jgi:hypothetical protein
MSALVIFLAALAVGLLLLKERGRRWPSPTVLLAAAPLGLLISAVVAAVAWYFGIAPELSVPILAGVAVPLFAGDLWKDRRLAQPGGELSVK